MGTALDHATLDYATLATMRGDSDYSGPLDHPCPLCGPDRNSEFNRARPTLRTWQTIPGHISFFCARCEAKGSALAEASFAAPPVVAIPARKPRAKSNDNDWYAERIWQEADAVLPAAAIGYFVWRGIPIEHVPEGAIRFHPRCPWRGKRVPCLLARYTDARTGKPRGLWRRSGLATDKPMTLGSMGGCVIRLWPDVTTRLVVGEGIESTLAAATRISYRGQPLRPAWAAGCAGNMRRLPVLEGVEELILLVDNDSSGTGQRAAEECATRWIEAGRNVTRLTPPETDTDFNDLVRHG
jgi:hypothetical protein